MGNKIFTFVCLILILFFVTKVFFYIFSVSYSIFHCTYSCTQKQHLWAEMRDNCTEADFETVYGDEMLASKVKTAFPLSFTPHVLYVLILSRLFVLTRALSAYTLALQGSIRMQDVLLFFFHIVCAVRRIKDINRAILCFWYRPRSSPWTSWWRCPASVGRMVRTWCVCLQLAETTPVTSQSCAHCISLHWFHGCVDSRGLMSCTLG